MVPDIEKIIHSLYELICQYVQIPIDGVFCLGLLHIFENILQYCM